MAIPRRRYSNSLPARCRQGADFCWPRVSRRRSIFWKRCAFSDADLSWLKGTRRFSQRLLDYLADFRFTGDVHAMPEGTAFFAAEPILRVTAPLPQAQFVELRLINILHFQSLVAAKAARCVLAAPKKLLVDFGMRRAHGKRCSCPGLMSPCGSIASLLRCPRSPLIPR